MAWSISNLWVRWHKPPIIAVLTALPSDHAPALLEAAISAACEQSVANFDKLPTLAPQLAQAAQLIAASLDSGHKVAFCGNGGSAADSQHLAAELAGRFLKDRKPLAALALTTDTSALTAIANDYGYAEVFARQIRGIGIAGDVLVAISTSGSSDNVVRASIAARELSIKVITLTGRSGGELAKHADLPIRFPADRTDKIQELHIAAGHIICGAVEEALCGEAKV